MRNCKILELTWKKKNLKKVKKNENNKEKAKKNFNAKSQVL